MNFVTDLLKFSFYKNVDVFNCVMITVDRFIKMTHYSFCAKTMNSKQFAYLLIKDVISLHDLFERIISDRKTLFISHFWTMLSKRLRVDHKLFLSFHSQTNEQTERQNQILKQYLKNVVNFLQNDWMNHLSFAEYIYNDSHHFVIQITFFKINIDRHFISFELHFYHDKLISTNVEKTAKEIIKLQEELTHRLVEAQNYQIMYYDRKHTSRTFSENDQVMLRLTNLKTEKFIKKLDIRFTEFFVIEKMINSQSYKLKLSKNFKIHSIFHVKLLESYKENKIKRRVIFFSFAVNVITQQKDENEWKVENIVKSRRRKKKIQYFVQWKNFQNTAKSRSWQIVDEIKNANELMKKFHEKHSLMFEFWYRVIIKLHN